MTDLFHAQARPMARASDLMRALIRSDDPITRSRMNAAMTSAFGGTDADGRWSQRDSFETLELALATELATGWLRPGKTEDLASIIALADRLPTQTVRSETQMAWHQFSTPIDLAGIATLLAAARADDVVLEPSAGNGLLVAQLGTVAALHLNEIDAARRERLGITFPSATITGHDGATVNATLAPLVRPNLILMNPPFSRSVGRGDDDYAAVRHLQAAIRLLAPRGRIVAIMPDWFGPSARMRDLFHATFRDMHVRVSIRLTRCYTKHGTSIAVRLYVADKAPGSAVPTTIQRDTVRDLLDAITVPSRLTPLSGPAMPKAARPALSLFGAVKAARVASPAVRTAPPVRNDVLPIGYEALQAPAPLLDQVGIYLPYRPSRIAFTSAGKHPTELVESIAMGSIPAPIPDYVPHLPERTVSDRLLSASQLESVIYAGQAWTQMLPGRFNPDDDGVGLKLADDGEAYRKGFFLGDGTGAGKGRQIAACILDNWLAGRRRNIIVTKNEPLLEDARRDWSALGGTAADIQPIGNWSIDQPIALDEGTLFVTYPTLRSMRGEHSRLQQILDWAGPDFDGVIAFDEAHEMGGVAGGEGALGAKAGSLQGVCGVKLQNHLPKARVLYASATGASEVNNLAYAVRLGLWGPETAFADRERFITDIRQGGIAAMELVARDLKAMGLYLARALSFAGVEYDILRHALTPEQITIYDTYSEAWSIIHRNMEDALVQTAVVDSIGGSTLNGGAKAAARSRLQSTMQRFFGQVLLGMKLPTIIAAVEDHLAAGQSVVLQLVSTAEAILERRLAALSPDERAELEIDLSPVDFMLDYVQRAFPTRQMRVFTDDTGTARSEPMCDADGNPVYNPEALAARDALIEHICALPPIMSALDGIIAHFGSDRVAEVTGRSRRLVLAANGQQQLESRSPRASLADASAFMDGTKRTLVFSDAGGTGRSYHASLDARNQQQRVHFLLEPGWRADRAIQGLGRTHRTHQASAPLFRPVTTDCKGELRFTSTIARRLDTLGALTRGQRQTGGQNLFDPADNLESDYALAALTTWYHLLVAGRLKSITLADFQHRTGLELVDKDGTLKEELPPIQRWLNRLLALPIGLQNAIFDEFLSLVETRVSAAREAGTLDVGVETIAVEEATIVDDTILRTDPGTGATSHLLTIEIAQRRKAVSIERILRIADGNPEAVLLRNAKSGMVALRLPARSLMEETDGTLIPRIELMRPTRSEYHRAANLYETAWEVIGREAFVRCWTAETEEAANTLHRETIRLATGLLLPIWSALPRDNMAVNRIAAADGRSWLGRIVDDPDVPSLYKTLGLTGASALPPADIARAVLAGRSIELDRPFAMTLRRSLVNGSQRVEISGCPASQLPWLKSLGAFTEIIAYRTRVFLPVAQAEAILARILS